RFWRAEIGGVTALHSPPKESAVADENCDAPRAGADALAELQPSPGDTIDEAKLREIAGDIGIADETVGLAGEALRQKVLTTLAALIEEQQQAQKAACEFSRVMHGIAEKDRRDAHVAGRIAAQSGRAPELPDGNDDEHRLAFSADGTRLLVADG